MILAAGGEAIYNELLARGAHPHTAHAVWQALEAVEAEIAASERRAQELG